MEATPPLAAKSNKPPLYASTHLPSPLSAAQRADNWARKCSRTTVLLITFCINLHSFPDVVLWRCLIQLDTKWKTNWAATPAGKMLVVVEKEYQAANKKAI